MAPRSRPLSPHLFIYRFTLTMAMSIVHRATGIANYAGTILLVAWLGAAALGEGPHAAMNAAFGHPLGQFVLFGYTWSLFHHMLGGLRHFVWDFIKGMEHPDREIIVRIHLGLSIGLTLITWLLFVWM